MNLESVEVYNNENIVNIKVEDKKVRVIGNGTVDIHNVVSVDLSDYFQRILLLMML